MEINLYTSLRKACAFFKRDFLINSSYRLSFLFDLGLIAFSVLTFFFISRLFGREASRILSGYGGDYFGFVLIGIAFSGYLNAGISGFTQAIAEEQSYGTLEAIILTPTKISAVLIYGSIWNFTFTSLRAAVYLLLGKMFFGFDLSQINLGAALIILLLSIISFSSMGIILAGFILIFKRGDPINRMLGGLSRFLGGVYFPVTLLPAWAQKIAGLLPITYSLEAMRKAIILGASPKELSSPIFALFVFSLLLFPLGILCFKLALRKAQKDGSLLYS